MDPIGKRTVGALFSEASRVSRGVTVLILTVATACVPDGAVTQGPEPPQFVEAWFGGPLDSIYNAEYQRLATACAGAGDTCWSANLDSTAVRLVPLHAEPAGADTVGWLATRLRTHGQWPYAALVFQGADGGESTLVEELGDWGYGSTLDLRAIRDGWIQPWILAAVGDYWLDPAAEAPGFGVVDGPFGLEDRLWYFQPLQATLAEAGPGAAAAPVDLPEAVYMILEVSDGTVRLRAETPTDMACGEPIDSAAAAAPVPVYELSLASLLDATGRPTVQVAYGRGC